jgi:hypothetical protein
MSENFVRNVYSLAADNDYGLSPDEDPTSQPQDQVFRTIIDAGRDEAIHPILLLTNSPSSSIYGTLLKTQAGVSSSSIAF